MMAKCEATMEKGVKEFREGQWLANKQTESGDLTS
jgi:hypothetical protein